jgi:hypothetical protein
MLGYRFVFRIEPVRRPSRRKRGEMFVVDEIPRQDRLRRLMRAVAETQASRAAGLSELVLQAQASSAPEQQLSQLPTTPIEWYTQRLSLYRNTRTPRHTRRPFEYHLDPMPRIAVLMDGFENTDAVQCFPEGWGEEMEKFKPEAIAGPVPALRRLATMVFSSGARLRHLRRPLIALSGLGFDQRAMMSEDDRNLFWRAFGVPVFERYLGFGLETLAKECEAHDGLHLNLDAAVFQTFFDGKHPELLVTSLDHLSHPVLRLATGLAADITFQPCRCGHPGPRITRLANIDTNWQITITPYRREAAKPAAKPRAYAAAAGT